MPLFIHRYGLPVQSAVDPNCLSDVEIADLNNEIADLNNEIADLNNEIADLNIEFAEFNVQVVENGLYTSGTEKQTSTANLSLGALSSRLGNIISGESLFTPFALPLKKVALG